MKNSSEEDIPRLNLEDMNARAVDQGKVYGLIENLSLSIPKGTIYGLICETYTIKSILERLLSGDVSNKNLKLESGKILVNGYNIYFKDKYSPKGDDRNGKGSNKAMETKKHGFTGYTGAVGRVSIIHENSHADIREKSTVLDQFVQRMLEEKTAELSDSIVMRTQMKEETLLSFMQEIQIMSRKERDAAIADFAKKNGMKGFTHIINQYTRNFYDPEISVSWLSEKMKKDYDNKIIDQLKILSSYERSERNLNEITTELIAMDESSDKEILNEKRKEIRNKKKEINSHYRNFQFLLKFTGKSLMEELKKEATLWAENYLNEMGVENADLLLIKSVEELSPGEEGLCSYVINTLWDPDLVIVEQSMDIFGPMGNPSVRRDMLRRSVENGTSFLILAKSLSDVRDICDHVGIMYSGRIVEEGETLDIVSDPKHPLTISMNAVEDMLNTGKRDESYRSYLQERPPDPELLPAGCYFEPRCKFSLDMCSTRRPVLSFTGSHKVACFLYSEKYEAPA